MDYVGCFADGDLTDDVGAVPLERTPDNCLRICHKKSMPYAGLMAGNGCKCGNERPRDSQKKLESDCNISCDGDPSIPCGGPSRKAVYYIRMNGQG